VILAELSDIESKENLCSDLFTCDILSFIVKLTELKIVPMQVAVDHQASSNNVGKL